MEKLFVFLMLFPFTLIIIFQPYLDRLEESREKVVQSALQRGVERAAIDGYFTQANIYEIKTLITSVGYNLEEIEFEGTSDTTYRGDYIEGIVRVPNNYQFLLLENFLTGTVSEKFHVHSGTRMSEYVN